MDALISAQAGTALLIQGSDLASIHAGAPEQAIPRRVEEVHLLFGEAADLEVLESVDRDEFVRRLTREVAATEALQLFLILLDTDMPEEIRREAAEELDSALADSECREAVKRVLYAHPLPATAELPSALAYAEGPAPRVQNLLRQLGDLQPAIAEVRRAWFAIPDALFASPGDRQRFQAALVRASLFREFVLDVRAGISVESFLATALLNPVLRMFQGYQLVMQVWAAPFRRRERTGERLKSEGKEPVNLSDEEGQKQTEKELAAKEEELKPLLAALQKKLDDWVEQVRLTNHLTNSPVCLVGTEHGVKTGRPQQRRIMELNPKHDIVAKLKQRYEADQSDPILDAYAQLLFGSGVLAEGGEIPEPIKFNLAVADLMKRAI